MDAHSSHNKISIHLVDENTSFIADECLYCYKMMPFELKYLGATYQKLVNKMFVYLIGKIMEIYVDDMMVKSLQTKDNIKHLDCDDLNL